jgi:hypothetical protein
VSIDKAMDDLKAKLSTSRWEYDESGFTLKLGKNLRKTYSENEILTKTPFELLSGNEAQRLTKASREIKTENQTVKKLILK